MFGVESPHTDAEEEEAATEKKGRSEEGEGASHSHAAVAGVLRAFESLSHPVHQPAYGLETTAGHALGVSVLALSPIMLILPAPVHPTATSRASTWILSGPTILSNKCAGGLAGSERRGMSPLLAETATRYGPVVDGAPIKTFRFLYGRNSWAP